MSTKRCHTHTALIVGSIAVGLIIVSHMIYSFLSLEGHQVTNDVDVEQRTVVVSGNSLTGVLEAGDEVFVTADVSHITRNDIVLYAYAGTPEPIIKIVKAVSGDTWRLEGCNIIVNDIILSTRNPDGTIGVPYCIGDTRRLQLYANDYPTIPPNTYLLMGNQPGGSMDGSVFGLVSGEDIIGKAEK